MRRSLNVMLQLLFDVGDGFANPEMDEAMETEPLQTEEAGMEKINSLRQSEDYYKEVSHYLF